jgi:glycosyltransferase involved in cell wall biosynthesis
VEGIFRIKTKYTSRIGGSVIESIRHAVGYTSRIRLLGHVPKLKTADFYSSTNVFVFPPVNSFEPFAIVRLEIIILGIQVIATNLPGVGAPVKQNGLGLLVESRTARYITGRLLKISDNSLELIRESEKLKRKYKTKRITDPYEEAYFE